MALINKLSNLGNAVRERSGLEQELTLDEMAEVVRNIPQPDLSPYATIEYVDEQIANIDIPEGSSVAVDGTTIIQNADGTISTAVGGYVIPGGEMFRWEGSLASEASAALDDISIFEDEFAEMDGDEVTISFVLDDEEYEEEYEVSATKREIVFENTKSELATITVNLTEETITVEHEGELLTELVINSATSYETINPGFIPVGRGLRRTAAAIMIDDSYIEEIIEDMGGTGGSVEIDGVTIVENEDGQLSTALGGGKVIVEKAVEAVSYEDETGFTNDSTPMRYTDHRSTNVFNSLDKSVQYAVEMEFYDTATGETGSCTGVMWYANTNVNYPWKFENVAVFDEVLTEAGFTSSQGNFFRCSGTYSQQCYITRYAFIKPAVYDFSKIDANYIPYGSGLRVTPQGELETTLAGIKTFGSGYALIREDYNPKDGTVTSGIILGEGSSYSGSQTNSCVVALGRNNRVYNTAAVAIGDACHAEDAMATAIGKECHASYRNLAIGYGAEARSQYTMAVGKYNVIDYNSAYNFIIGNGTSNSARANGLTIDASGNVVTQGTISNAGADYAEYFEWADGNPNGEDRVGLLVALDGNKIRLAQPGDDVLGIVSGTATVLGDDAEWAWQGKYMRDEFGRLIMEEIELYDEDGQVSGHTMAPKINPNYDENKEYISRAKRAEWDAIGMMGKLFVRDDGSCQVNGYATVAANGLASSSTGKTNMRVMERISDNIVRVCMK